MCEAKKQITRSTTYMMMTVTIPSLESSCLAFCSPLHVRVHCRLFHTVCPNKLVILLVASAMTAIHRDRLVLASYALWPGIQPLMPRGQIVFGDLLLLTDGHHTNYNLNKMMVYNGTSWSQCEGLAHAKVAFLGDSIVFLRSTLYVHNEFLSVLHSPSYLTPLPLS